MNNSDDHKAVSFLEFPAQLAVSLMRSIVASQPLTELENIKLVFQATE